MKANIIDIIKGTTVDGPGFRTSVYFAGCLHCCKGCHNPESWSFDAGQPMTIDQLMEIIREEDFDVTLTGGDPLYRPEFTYELASLIRQEGHTVWLYTGFTWEEIIESPVLRKVMDKINVVVDSPFAFSLRDPDLLFRGYSKQRIIDVSASLKAGNLIIWERT